MEKTVQPKTIYGEPGLAGGFYQLTAALYQGRWYAAVENTDNWDDWAIICPCRDENCAWRHVDKLIDNCWEI